MTQEAYPDPTGLPAPELLVVIPVYNEQASISVGHTGMDGRAEPVLRQLCHSGG
jgi:hypothetical protein